jgi:hypothetical protein
MSRTLLAGKQRDNVLLQGLACDGEGAILTMLPPPPTLMPPGGLLGHEAALRRVVRRIVFQVSTVTSTAVGGVVSAMHHSS